MCEPESLEEMEGWGCDRRGFPHNQQCMEEKEGRASDTLADNRGSLWDLRGWEPRVGVWAGAAQGEQSERDMESGAASSSATSACTVSSCAS